MLCAKPDQNILSKKGHLLSTHYYFLSINFNAMLDCDFIFASQLCFIGRICTQHKIVFLVVISSQPPAILNCSRQKNICNCQIENWREFYMAQPVCDSIHHSGKILSYSEVPNSHHIQNGARQMAIFV